VARIELRGSVGASIDVEKRDDIEPDRPERAGRSRPRTLRRVTVRSAGPISSP
jgi:hypothetical protein